jgi:hypothetical protein
MAAASFRTRLTLALGQARAELDQLIAGQRLYAFALYTSGESDFSYLCASANSEDRRDAKAYADFIAVLHRLYPRRFPETRMSSTTNRLQNPEPFLL